MNSMMVAAVRNSTVQMAPVTRKSRSARFWAESTMASARVKCVSLRSSSRSADPSPRCRASISSSMSFHCESTAARLSMNS